MTAEFPKRKLVDLRHRLESWFPRRREATGRKVLSLARKLHHAACVIRQGWYFVHSLIMRLANLHVNGEELRGGGDTWGGLRKKEETRAETGVYGGRGQVEMVREPG